jgi:hypothetical protein
MVSLMQHSEVAAVLLLHECMATNMRFFVRTSYNNKLCLSNNPTTTPTQKSKFVNNLLSPLTLQL